MCALVGFMVPRRPLVVELSYDDKVLVWALIIESGHIPLRTLLGNCSRDLYRPLRLRLLAWAQRVVKTFTTSGRFYRRIEIELQR